MFKPIAALLAASLLIVAGCGGGEKEPEAIPTASTAEPSATVTTPAPPSAAVSPTAATASAPATAAPTAASSSATPSAAKNTPAGNSGNGQAIQVIAQPETITVLVNKQYKLPDNYEPKDLVFPDVAFTFKEQSDKRKLRKEAAGALEKLFAGAKADGITLLGVSGYRSSQTQAALFNSYVKKDGEQKALTYSARPGHSEHQTGLAIDVTGGDGRCAAQDCFADTKEAKWLAQHAAEYGFIVRFLKGKETVTGYQYEPWHIRYVGVELAKEITSKGLVLEEYVQAVPVTKP